MLALSTRKLQVDNNLHSGSLTPAVYTRDLG